MIRKILTYYAERLEEYLSRTHRRPEGKILTYYAERLEEYLSRTHRRPEGLATVGMIGE